MSAGRYNEDKRDENHKCVGKRKCVENFVGKPEGKRLLGRPGRRWEENILTVPKEIGLGGGA